jgi:hypothetical protein
MAHSARIGDVPSAKPLRAPIHIKEGKTNSIVRFFIVVAFSYPH